MYQWLTVAQASSDVGFIGLIFAVIGGLIGFCFAAVMIAAMWKLFTKAGKPGWAAIIPIYNMVVVLELIGRPIWWIALFFIPFVNFLVGVVVTLELAKSFGKDMLFGLGMLFFGIIFTPILGFGSARYQGPQHIF